MKKELYLPTIIVALTLVFGIICLMVYLSDGNAYWIKKKLKIGALLLTFTWFANSCEKGPFENTCYLPPMPDNSIWIKNSSDSLVFSLGDTLFLQVSNPTYPFFSYEILDKSLNSIQSDMLRKLNDSSNFSDYYFLVFKNELASEKYKINFYGEEQDSVTLKNKISSYEFSIK